MKQLASGIYSGWVRHRRFEPHRHAFKYRVFMMYLDLAEQHKVLAQSWLWGPGRWALARFRRKDYLGENAQDLDTTVRQLVQRELDMRIDGPIRVLTNFRYFGFLINPLTVYYCFDKSEQLQAMVLEVTNTPWRKRHQYVLACDPHKKNQRIRFDKAMHVSPFNPVNMVYHLKSSKPGAQLSLHLENWQTQARTGCVFDASLALQRQEISGTNLNRVLVKFPFMTLKVFWGIYWQALKLFLKKVPLYKYGEMSKQEG